MTNLKTNYLGIEIKNPIVVGASNLSTDIKTLRKLQEAGAGAIVYKSLFEEQIQIERLEFENELTRFNDFDAEIDRIFPSLEHAGPKEFLMGLKEAKNQLDIPVIGSLNAINIESWIDYAKQIENTGVDALELNFYTYPDEPEKDSNLTENEQVEIFKRVKAAVNIPVSVKLSPFYSNPSNIIKRFVDEGAAGVVLFNKLFQPDILIDEEKHHFPYNLSSKDDNRLPLRFAGLLYDKIQADIIASSGIYTGEDVIKMILAGADSVQIVSTLYKNGINQIVSILTDIEKYMQKKGHNSISEFKGKLSKAKTNDPYTYKRSQYVDILFNSEKIFKDYPVR